MKKIATLFAVGVVALGASAQADGVQHTVESTEYAVITIPVVAGNNLIGISVEADKVSLPTVLSGIAGGATVKVWDGAAYTNSTVGQLTVSKGDSFFVYTETAGTAYELGAAPSEAANVEKEVLCNMDIVAPPFANEWSLSDLAFSTAGGNRISVANKVHVWNGSGYDTYWFKNGTPGAWRNKIATNSVPVSFGAGQSFFVELGNGTSTKPTSGTVTFTKP